MRLAIMQPYLFPYIGYFQLVAACDTFVFLDDVGFIKQGWINRNRIESGGQPAYFTVPLADASPNRSIAQTQVSESVAWRPRLRRTLEQAYARTRHRNAALAMFDAVITAQGPISEMAAHSVQIVSAALGLSPRFLTASRDLPAAGAGGQARVLTMCRQLGATEYVNLPGGRSLYDAATFAGQGISLRFVEPNLQPYDRGGRDFLPALSILDALMFNEPGRITQLAKGPGRDG